MANISYNTINKKLNDYSENVKVLNPVRISTIQNPVSIKQNLDAFGRLRVSLPTTAYEYNFQYSSTDIIWQTKLGGAGTSTHIPAQSSVRMNTNSAPTANLTKLIGFGDNANGVFFGVDAGGAFFLLRSSSSGIVSDARKIYQSNWNTNKYVDLDTSKIQIFVFDIAWLGVSNVKCGFQLPNTTSITWCHIFYNANLYDKTYMTTANLPVRYQIVDGADSVLRQTYQYFRYRPAKSLNGYLTFNMFSNLQYLDQICASIVNETAGDNESYFQSSVSRGTTAKLITTTRNNILTIRPKALFQGQVNRGSIFQESIELLVTGTGTIFWELIYNPTLGGVPVWNNPSNNALFEFDIAGTTVTGGEVVDSGYVSSSATVKNNTEAIIGAKYPLSLDIDGLNPKSLTLCATSVSGNIDVYAKMTVRSYY